MKWQSMGTWQTTHRGLRLEVCQYSRGGRYFWRVLRKEIDLGFGDAAQWITEANGEEQKLDAAKREAVKAARELRR